MPEKKGHGLERRIWLRRPVEKRNNYCVLSSIILTYLPLIYVFIQAVIWPGPVYCRENDCPDLGDRPEIPDSISVVVVLLLFLIASMISCVILFSSGSWMFHAYEKKIFSLGNLIFIGFGIILLISPISRRGYVLPTYRISEYKITISLQNESTSTGFFQVENFLNPVNDGFGDFFIRVESVSSLEDDILDLGPFSDVIFQDKNSFDLSENPIITRTIKGLKEEHWYMFLILPAKNTPLGPRQNVYLSPQLDFLTTTNDENFTNVFVDLRGWLVCQWNSSNVPPCQNQKPPF